MYQTIIVPLNGSPAAEAALPTAIDEAKRHGAGLVLVRVVPRPELASSPVRRSGPAPVPPEWPEEELAADRAAARRYLERVVAEHGLGDREPSVELAVPVGEPCRQLLAIVRRRPAPLVVLGIERGPPNSNDLGRRLLRSGAAPVLAVVTPPAGPATPVDRAAPCPDPRSEDTRPPYPAHFAGADAPADAAY